MIKVERLILGLPLLLSCFLLIHSSLSSLSPDAASGVVAPYLMPKDHPIKSSLDELFLSGKRIIASRNSLVEAGFEDRNPEPRTGVFVLRHREFKGYIFKIYTDDQLTYYRNEPEYITWMLRARGAKLIRNEIKARRWEKYFKVPRKWIYPLPEGAVPAQEGHLQKYFILVEDEMDILPNEISRQIWSNGSVSKEKLTRLFTLITKVGLRGGCKYDNIPFCRDGRIAFIDTQNNLSWPLPYHRLLPVLKGQLRRHWLKLMEKGKKL